MPGWDDAWPKRLDDVSKPAAERHSRLDSVFSNQLIIRKLSTESNLLRGSKSTRKWCNVTARFLGHDFALPIAWNCSSIFSSSSMISLQVRHMSVENKCVHVYCVDFGVGWYNCDLQYRSRRLMYRSWKLASPFRWRSTTIIEGKDKGYKVHSVLKAVTRADHTDSRVTDFGTIDFLASVINCFKIGLSLYTWELHIFGSRHLPFTAAEHVVHNNSYWASIIPCCRICEQHRTECEKCCLPQEPANLQESSLKPYAQLSRSYEKKTR